MPALIKLNVGCGRMIHDDWTNIDIQHLPGVDIVCDVEKEIPLPDDHADVIVASHLIEHLHNPLDFMAELHRVAKPGARAYFYCPYGSSDDADEDPTHVRRMFKGSWSYFGQPMYSRASYGYSGDWQTKRIILQTELSTGFLPKTEELIKSQRNVVIQMIALLECVKPIRDVNESGSAVELEIARMNRDNVRSWYEELHV